MLYIIWRGFEISFEIFLIIIIRDLIFPDRIFIHFGIYCIILNKHRNDYCNENQRN